MRQIREVLRLRHQGLTERVIAQMLGVSNGVVHGYVRRARLAGLSSPLPEGLDDDGLDLLLFPAPMAASQSDRRPIPDWIYVEKELRRRNVARLLLWEEYRADNIKSCARSNNCADASGKRYNARCYLYPLIGRKIRRHLSPPTETRCKLYSY
jgi:hypothetical protein